MSTAPRSISDRRSRGGCCCPGTSLSRPANGSAGPAPDCLPGVIESMGFVPGRHDQHVAGASPDPGGARCRGIPARGWTSVAPAGVGGRLFEATVYGTIASIIPTRWFAHMLRPVRRGIGALCTRCAVGGGRDRVGARGLESVLREGRLMMSRISRHAVAIGAPRAWVAGSLRRWRWIILWRIGRLHVWGRREFQKVYDLDQIGQATGVVMLPSGRRGLSTSVGVPLRLMERVAVARRCGNQSFLASDLGVGGECLVCERGG